MTKQNKIQNLLITHLQKYGEINLTLPGGTSVRFGVTQEGKHGKEFCENYCWVETSQDDRTTYIDTYNLGVTCPNNKLVFMGEGIEEFALDII